MRKWSCARCVQSKRRCEGGSPCARCTRLGFTCEENRRKRRAPDARSVVPIQEPLERGNAQRVTQDAAREEEEKRKEGPLPVSVGRDVMVVGTPLLDLILQGGPAAATLVGQKPEPFLASMGMCLPPSTPWFLLHYDASRRAPGATVAHAALADGGPSIIGRTGAQLWTPEQQRQCPRHIRERQSVRVLRVAHSSSPQLGPGREQLQAASMITIYDCDGHARLNFVFLKQDASRRGEHDNGEMQIEGSLCSDLMPREELSMQDDSFQVLWGAPGLAEDFLETPTWLWDDKENPF